MISQQEIVEIALKLFGSTKILSEYLDTPAEELECYLRNQKEMTLSLYMKTQMLIEKEIDHSIESFFEPDCQDFLTMKRIRKNLNLSLQDMASLLGISGTNAPYLVKLMENGSIPIIGPVSRILRYLSQTTFKSNNLFQDSFTICIDQTAARPQLGVFATSFPRFFAKKVSNDNLSSQLPSIELNSNYSLEISMWIDIPRVQDEKDAFKRLELASKLLDSSKSEQKLSI